MTASLPAGGVTAALLGPLLAGDAHRPRLIWHGAGRTELSTASLANWSAKAAGLLVDELAAGPGGTVLWRVRRSWQGVPLLLGAWWAGMVVTDLEDAAAEAVVAFVDEGEDSAADEVVVASSHPFGLPTVAVKAHQRQVADAVLPQADRFAPRRPSASADSAAVVAAAGAVSIRDILDRATRAGEAIGSGGRVLSVLDLTLPDGVAAGLLGALAADGSLLQVTTAAGLDAARLAAIARDERATCTLGCDVDGLLRLG